MRIMPALIFPIILLAACDKTPTYCEKDIEPQICRWQYPDQNKIFEVCMENLAKMRSSAGGNYTTNDDEDLDQAIRACSRASHNVASSKLVCVDNPKYLKQQEICKENQDANS